MPDEDYTEVELRVMLLAFTAHAEKWPKSYLLSRLDELAGIFLRHGRLHDYQKVMEVIDFMDEL